MESLLPPMSFAETLFFDCIHTSYCPTHFPRHSRTLELTRCPSLLPQQFVPLSFLRISLFAFLPIIGCFSLPCSSKSPATIAVRIRQLVAWDTESFQISWIFHQIQIKTMFAGFEALNLRPADDMMLLNDPLGQTDFTYPLSRHLTSVKQEKVIEGLF